MATRIIGDKLGTVAQLRDQREIRNTSGMPGSRLRVALLALAVVLSLVTGCARKAHPLAAGSTVLALGDSLTFGTGATPEASYPAVLAAVTSWKVINAGIPGNTAQEGCARLQPLLEEHRPRLVLVFLGGNDMLRRQSAQAITTGLAHCVRDVKAVAIPLVLFAVPKFDLTGFSDAPLFEEFAAASGVQFLSPRLGALLRDEALRSDSIHLNADGYRALATNIADGLRRLGYLAR